MEKENLLLTCSGGETSMFMVIWCWRNLQDKYNMKIVFANTGQESDETIEFIRKAQQEFELPITYIETVVHHGKRKGCTHKEVRFEDLTRWNDWKSSDTTPFEEVIKKYSIPNHSRLHCTRELKMNPIKSFAKQAFGKKVKYTLAIGIRTDEIDRVNAKRKDLGIVYPLIEWQPMSKKHINFWWAQQDFRLNLKGYQGNCISCYKKSKKKLLQIAKENPESFGFFDKMEKVYGNVNGRVPQKVEVTYIDELGEEITELVLETLPPEDYKNTIFREFRTAQDILEASIQFNGSVEDDHIETESCEIFSNCGEE